MFIFILVTNLLECLYNSVLYKKCFCIPNWRCSTNIVLFYFFILSAFYLNFKIFKRTFSVHFNNYLYFNNYFKPFDWEYNCCCGIVIYITQILFSIFYIYKNSIIFDSSLIR